MFSKLLHTFENFILKFLPFYFYPKKSKVFTLSKFRAGLKCDSLLWYYYNHNKIYKTKEYKQNPYRNPQFDQLIFYAQSLFKDAISIQTTYPEKSAKITSDMLTHKKPIFNAGVLYNDLFSKNGILVPSANKDKWDIIEIKHTNTVKKDSFMELAYQVYVAELCGLKIQKCYVLLINSDYYCNNSMDIEPSKFFIKQDITESVRTSIPFMKTKLEHFKKVIHAQNPLKKSLNHSCKTPKSCTINSFVGVNCKKETYLSLERATIYPRFCYNRI